ncbi:hypothetical protein CLPUN_06790 [Clostridium puniceum]|uniref:Homeodomain phBC6A51-type domain-containing protein n=1 Tax=Clostridium puniceum TaxID=29367 RepID=A0A1S8TW17_9CLOT|nr:phBC6A51 family helix-turn-helix protein [Clostridium puniceum]OOM81964.1 hypothetical protein CLPUN_06790 [Clostridium puniceum]
MLDEKHMNAIKLLSPKTMSKAEIAERVGISTRTLNRWENDEEFRAELDRRREQLKKTGRNEITDDICTYINNMKEMANQKTDNRVRFQANKYLIDQCLGSPSAVKEDSNNTSKEKEGTDQNALKNEIDEIKNIRVVK